MIASTFCEDNRFSVEAASCDQLGIQEANVVTVAETSTGSVTPCQDWARLGDSYAVFETTT